MTDSLTIKKLTSEAVCLLKEMIAIPSVSFNEDDVCSHIHKWLNNKGIESERIGNNLIAESVADPTRPMLMLCAHIDTVQPADDYSFDPYTPDYETAADIISLETGQDLKLGDVVAGIGSNDDGASVVAMISAFIHLNGKANLTLVLTCEEERSGKGGMTQLWPIRLNRIKYAIIGEPTEMKAATSERGLLVIDALAEGRSGHAARNEGINALYIALDDITRLRQHKFARISSRMGEVNLNVTQISAGRAHNVIPDRCSFVIDIRPTEKYTNEDILDELQSICNSRLTPRNLSNRSSATSDASPLTETVRRLGIETFSSPTTSDWMRTGCDAIKMGPGSSSRSHKKNEYVTVNEIEEGIRTYIDFIEDHYEHTLE